jgi:hypothetical protein
VAKAHEAAMCEARRAARDLKRLLALINNGVVRK